MARTAVLHVHVDEALKTDASEKLADIGLTVSDAVQILLARVVEEGGLPAALASDAASHGSWFRAKVEEALGDTQPPASHTEVMDEAQALIDQKRRARS